MKLQHTIEAILFAGARPFSIKKLADLCECSVTDVEDALKELSAACANRGIMLQRSGTDAQLVTKPEASDIVAQVVREEAFGELTRPALEALTILAYRGPMTRPELEQIRGIQSALILRNLMLRGLVEEQEDRRLGQSVYAITFDFIRHLGLSSVEDLPEYEEMRGHEVLTDALADLEAGKTAQDGTKELKV
ncbi:SMC-Scp complex subunit ScpB [Patescibacteria group bacterium]|uniref:SMC-Scp complex subunit ScpB n=1 Tax=candidate division WWE3 bacterium TaxID=2053526 RepID=A0A928Y4N9_UNCKA|nr:SMC-Scp complex subunit ScpB [candidate division WWE3 bacterium]MCL4732783.1 SMC-Scp complex subunit ScpB [Patescibacteria group bacterium]